MNEVLLFFLESGRNKFSTGESPASPVVCYFGTACNMSLIQLGRITHAGQSHPHFNDEVRGDGRIPFRDVGVSENWGTPKWMVYNGKPY